MSEQGNVFVYEAPEGKGCGIPFELPSPYEFLACAIVLEITSTLVKEFSKDLYVALKNLFKKGKESGWATGKYVIKQKTHYNQIIHYYFPKYLSEIDFADALLASREHFLRVDDAASFSVKEYDYIFDRKSGTWLPF